MSLAFIEDQIFESLDFNKSPLKKGNYENCQFHHCNFADLRLTSYNFIDCQFNNCDWSNAKLSDTGLQNLDFNTCKLIGLRFDSCNPFLFGANFTNSKLDFSSFYQVNLKKSTFKDCSFKEVDFTEADLTSIHLEHCNLERAIFDQTNLQKTDLSSAVNFNIDPSINKIQNARFSSTALVGLLKKYNLDLI